MKDLPPGWANAILGDVIELRYGKSLPEKARNSGEFKVYGSNGVVGSHAAAVTGAPAIVVGRKGSIGEVHFSSNACYPIDTTYYVDRFDVLDPRFAMQLLLSLPLREMNRASAIPGLNREDAYGLPIIVPPLPEQHRIATRLDALSEKSKRTRDHLGHIPRLVEKYRQALLAAAFLGKLQATTITGAKEVYRLLEDACRMHRRLKTISDKQPEPLFDIPGHWCWATAEMIVEPGAEIIYGIVQPGPKLPTGIPYVRGTDIENGRIKLDQLLFTSKEIAERYERASLRGGDILLGIIRATKVAIVPDALTGGNITQGTARFRPSKLVSTDYLAYWLQSQSAQSWLHSKYRGIDMPGLNLRDVRQLPVPIPPIKEQHLIAAKIKRSFAQADRIFAEATRAATLVDRLDQGILAKGLRGELVRQDPTDEPANVLLERIKAERRTRPQQGKKQKSHA